MPKVIIYILYSTNENNIEQDTIDNLRYKYFLMKGRNVCKTKYNGDVSRDGDNVRARRQCVRDARAGGGAALAQLVLRVHHRRAHVLLHAHTQALQVYMCYS